MIALQAIAKVFALPVLKSGRDLALMLFSHLSPNNAPMQQNEILHAIFRAMSDVTSYTPARSKIMSSSVTIRKTGNSIGIALPAETRIRLGLEVGQELTLVELSDGIKLVKRNLELERQMAAARDVLREQADVLQELAKR